VDVTQQDLPVGLSIDQKGLVSPLEQVPDPVVASIKPLSVGRLKASHDPRERRLARFDHEVNVVAHQAIGDQSKSVTVTVMPQESEIDLSIVVGSEEISALISARDDVIQTT